jgi:hypothetical protein
VAHKILFLIVAGVQGNAGNLRGATVLMVSKRNSERAFFGATRASAG